MVHFPQPKSASLLAEVVEGRALLPEPGSLKLGLLGMEAHMASWLGRTVDERFVDEIAASGVDPCGETAE